MAFEVVNKFENKIAEFFGAPYAVAVDCCTHGIELCLRQQEVLTLIVPKRTYLSVPMLANKLNIRLQWSDEQWEDYYWLEGTNIIDAAVLWKKDSYIPNTFMCVSFQFQKHLSLGRGGIILTDNKEAAIELKKMSYDGRLPNVPWRDQNIDTMGYHYYMAPEIALMGLNKLEKAINTPPKKWSIDEWPDLTEMEIFKTTEDYCIENNISIYTQTK
jgi:dTDP-4-amino-4,6-dideoxygalactose transaminase|tara:strand:- start:1107 stop:1751 length:645 start_codon:yes stop_codon:yes gene_type:complete